MKNAPDTHASLILRLRDYHDAAAWEEFTSLYQPVVYRLARRHGLQDADAREAVQEVLLATARGVAQWDPAGAARFRTWLFRVFRNKLIDLIRRRSRQADVRGGSSMAVRISQQPDVRESLSAEIDREYRRELFHRAAGEVRRQVKPETWQAFWRTGVDGVGAEEVARELGMSIGAVYIARSRVLARLREFVTRHEE